MRTAIQLCLILGTAASAFAQPAAPAGKRLEFEVASIKPAAPPAATGAGGMFFVRMGMKLNGARMEYPNVSLKELVRTAYGVKDFQVVAPDWMGSLRFDVEAKMPEGATKEQVPEMLQSLLADRFKLVMHRDAKDHDVYGLVIGKNGPKLKEADPNAKIPGLADQKGLSESAKKAISEAMAGSGSEGKPVMVFSRTTSDGGGGGRMSTGGTSTINSRNVTLASFADTISRFVDRPVVDMTGIAGNYDFALEVGSDEMMRTAKAALGGNIVVAGDSKSGADGMAEAPSNTIFQSVQNYGLKLEKRKAPVEMIVVDRAEKVPTEN